MSDNSYTAVVIPVAEDEPITRIRIAERHSLPALQELVGGNIEAVPYHGSDEVTTYINEEGKFTLLKDCPRCDGSGRERYTYDGEPPEDAAPCTECGGERRVVEVNPRATRLMAPGLFAGDFIAGPLVVCGFDAETGENRDCPDGFEEAIR